VEKPLFLPKELAREKEVVLGEYDRQEASPFFGLDQAMAKRLYPGNFSRKNVFGDRDVVRNVTPEQMGEIQRRYYVPNNSALLITGDVTPSRAVALADTVFRDWQRGADPFLADPVPPIPPLDGNQAVISEAPVSAVTVLLQWQGPSVGADPNATYAADVFSDVMNQPGSRLQKRLIESGLWEGISVDRGILVNYYTLNHVGPITISGQTTAEKLRPALAALEDEISHFTGLRDERGAHGDQGAAHGVLGVRPRADVRLHSRDRILVGGRQPRLLHGVRRQHGGPHDG